ncbi:MAG: helix-turn-helix domain-containing protein [Hyphomonas sp.]
MQFIEVVELIAAYHALILAIIVLLVKSPKILGLFCTIFAAHMLTNIGVSTDLLPLGADIRSAFGLTYGPMMYIFVRELSFKNARRRFWVDLLHFAPAVLIVLFRPADPIPQLIGFPLILGYYVAIFLRLKEHGRLVVHIRADEDSVDLQWVNIIFFAFVAISVVDFARSFFLSNGSSVGDFALAATLSCVVALLSTMVWKSIVHTQNTGAISDYERNSTCPEEELESDHHAAVEMFAKIDAIVKEKRLWREPRLTLDDVARITAHTAREVSHAINAVHQANFSNYINGLRVADVDALMDDDESQGLTLLDLALEAGFNSKSAFNRHYQKLRGEPPSNTLRRKRSARNQSPDSHK